MHAAHRGEDEALDEIEKERASGSRDTGRNSGLCEGSPTAHCRSVEGESSTMCAALGREYAGKSRRASVRLGSSRFVTLLFYHPRMPWDRRWIGVREAAHPGAAASRWKTGVREARGPPPPVPRKRDLPAAAPALSIDAAPLLGLDPPMGRWFWGVCLALWVLLGAARGARAALACDVVQKHLEGKPPKKLIVVPGRLVNIVV